MPVTPEDLSKRLERAYPLVIQLRRVALELEKVKKLLLQKKKNCDLQK